MLNGLGICSGIGRLEHALDPWVNWVAHCEREPYPAAVLLGQTGVPTWDDLLTFPWKDFAGKIDIVAAGFPCQDVSTAGLGLGLDGQRSILVFEILKGCGKIEPQYIFLENVPRVTALMGERIITDLALLGYDARWLCLRSPDTSPIQEGERWFLLAQANSARLSGGTIAEEIGREAQSSAWSKSSRGSATPDWHKQTEYELRRNIDGVPYRIHRIKALGNAVVSEQARQAFQILSGLQQPTPISARKENEG